MYLVGRALSGLFDLACVWLLFVLGRLLGRGQGGPAGRGSVRVSAALPLQQSHFYTVDTFGTFFSLVTFYFAVR